VRKKEESAAQLHRRRGQEYKKNEEKGNERNLPVENANTMEVDEGSSGELGIGK
jgi:hypothetical protein